MSIYTPKIVIAQFGKTGKARKEHQNGEMQLLIEKDLSVDDKRADEPLKHSRDSKMQA